MLIEVTNVGYQIEQKSKTEIDKSLFRKMAINPNAIKYIYNNEREMEKQNGTKYKLIYHEVYFNDDTLIYILERDYIKLFDK